MRWLDDVDGPIDAREVLDQMKPEHFRALGPGLDKLSRAEIDAFVDDMAPWMRPGELRELFSTAEDATKLDIVEAVSRRGDPALQRTFADLAQRDVLAADTRVARGEGLSAADRELMLDLGQLALDIAGIIDPTPGSDGTNAVISLLRGDWFGATTSAISILPAIGDLAKFGKLGRWAQTVEQVISRAATDSAFATRVRPALRKIGELIDAISRTVYRGLPDSVRTKLDDIQSAIGAFRAARIGGNVTGRLGDNRVDWTLDGQGRPVRAEARPTEVHAEPRTSEETRLQRQAGGADRADDDQGGHLTAHRFIGEDGGLANLFPQNANFNLSAYKTLENELADWIRAGGEVRMNVNLRYGNDGTRPDRVEVSYTVHHPDTGELIFEDGARFRNESSQTFDRRTGEFIATRTAEFGL